jgi:hypothetical protein
MSSRDNRERNVGLTVELEPFMDQLQPAIAGDDQCMELTHSACCNLTAILDSLQTIYSLLIPTRAV